MMTANPPGQSGGFTSSSTDNAGFDTIMKFRKTRRNMFRRSGPKILENVNNVLNYRNTKDVADS